MKQISVADPEVFVLADDSQEKGRLFEDFVALWLAGMGFEKPTTANLRITANGIEVDVQATHRLTRERLVAECKAYSSNLPASDLTSFYGKLQVLRFEKPDLRGFFVGLPRLTAEGEEQAGVIESKDAGFRYIRATDLTAILEEQGLIDPTPLRDELMVDPVVVISRDGLYTAARKIDPETRQAMSIAVWGFDPVPESVLRAIRESKLPGPLQVAPLGSGHAQPTDHPVEVPTLVQVAASTSDFEYQLPAAPKFFVGRRELIHSLNEELSASGSSVVVLNAQSGWGKSSLALRASSETGKLGGVALVLDARTAAGPAFVTAALAELASRAVKAGLISLPSNPVFATIQSSVNTLKASVWNRTGPLLLFFDQFENVFRDIALTQAFRDLALLVKDLNAPLKLGFAWKTDLVGWTEGHPYHLRDQIRDSGSVMQLGPLRANEISTLLNRLQKVIGQPLTQDMRARLREYSAGLPWLFKKLAGHLIEELRSGATQEQLLDQALNIRSLFDSDLAVLSPHEYDVLKTIARSAPVPVSDLLDTIDSEILQSLLNKRLVVQVGERIDTYWDIFRDYVNTGTVPIQDTYILRLSPTPSMGRILEKAIEAGGVLEVSDATELLGTSELVVFNTVRELRLLRMIQYQAGQIRVPDDVLEDPESSEAALRERAASALRRHRAYSVLQEMLAQAGGDVTVTDLARRLPREFPAVDVKESTWTTYARALARWFEYAGLIGLSGSFIRSEPEPGKRIPMIGRAPEKKMSDSFPTRPAGPSIEMLAALLGGDAELSQAPPSTRGLSELRKLGLVERDPQGRWRVKPTLRAEDEIPGEILTCLTERIRGAPDALAALRSNPNVSPSELGEILEDAQEGEWSTSTRELYGKNFRSWARAAGIDTGRKGRRPAAPINPPDRALF